MIRFPPQRILVPMDVSGPSFSALEAAKSIARKTGASLDLVYIQDFRFDVPALYPDGAIVAMPSLQGVRDEFRKWCMHKLQQAVRDFPRSRVRVRATWGLPAANLADLARGKSADLVVMGTHGYAGLDRAIYGSVAEAVIRRATLPVLAVHERSKPPRMSKILVPYNRTYYADRALAYALRFARGMRARMEVLYVAASGESKTDALGRLKESASVLLRKYREAPLELRVAQGDPRHVIIQRAKGFDMIVLSAHRRPFSSDFVLGSTVERVLRHSPVPVLAIPSVGTKEWSEVQLYAGGVPTEKIRLPA